MLCCLTIGEDLPISSYLTIPTNNLDILTIDILLAAVNEYEGSLLVASYDTFFSKR